MKYINWFHLLNWVLWKRKNQVQDSPVSFIPCAPNQGLSLWYSPRSLKARAAALAFLFFLGTDHCGYPLFVPHIDNLYPHLSQKSKHSAYCSSLKVTLAPIMSPITSLRLPLLYSQPKRYIWPELQPCIANPFTYQTEDTWSLLCLFGYMYSSYVFNIGSWFGVFLPIKGCSNMLWVGLKISKNRWPPTPLQNF